MYLNDKGRSIVLRATGECLQELAKSGGPRCCKESIYIGFKILKNILKKFLTSI